MNLISINVRSDTTTIPARKMGAGTWAEYTSPAKTGHRFIITRTFDDGTEKTSYTNAEGEGLFSRDNNGAEYQITGTSQFSVKDKTSADAKRWFRGKFSTELKATGAKLTFDLDY